MTYNTLSANTLKDQLPLSSKQALRDSSGSLKERTKEPLGSLNKVYRAHFAWPTLNACVKARACTSILGKPAHLNLNHELHQAVAPPGLTHLTYRWRERASEGRTRRTLLCTCVYV